jgi:hypothetical protein
MITDMNGDLAFDPSEGDVTARQDVDGRWVLVADPATLLPEILNTVRPFCRLDIQPQSDRFAMPAQPHSL